ncbi:hypothetical protein ASG17_11380 [Brevundimonas sp. Leaf363]|uniref:Crp/Fnr family transcriptional regulator n=1 Tax=Brevundimonas sp. Leaf363 TaxID=1736353 RepID=UPI0006F1D858|nr:helix-turn-helix domain-containing protein [Brevundimonas sp. Leaf363]KQS54245.1 hypothetical protein ASG17_11380 [Brevundimonas sp. Leaf363]
MTPEHQPAPGAAQTESELAWSNGLSLAALVEQGVRRSAKRGQRIEADRSTQPGVTVVVEGVACLTHPSSGLCTGLFSAGDPMDAGAARRPAIHGRWLTDGAVCDIPFDALVENLGLAAALAVVDAAAAYRRESVEWEMACSIQHQAPQRIARWVARMVDASGVVAINQAELAALAGIQRTSVSAAMMRFRAAGVKVLRGRIIASDIAALQQTACACGPHAA